MSSEMGIKEIHMEFRDDGYLGLVIKHEMEDGKIVDGLRQRFKDASSALLSAIEWSKVFNCDIKLNGTKKIFEDLEYIRCKK